MFFNNKQIVFFERDKTIGVSEPGRLGHIFDDLQTEWHNQVYQRNCKNLETPKIERF